MYYDEPGLYTDVINPFPFPDVTWPYLHDCGFKWVTFQTYNPNLYPGVKTFDLPAVRAHGFTNVGVWGVIYSRTDFYSGGKALGAAAKLQGADHLIVDAEECLKDTRSTAKAQDIIRGVRDGGWTGAVDLSTLGAPWSPSVNDYEMDTKSFLDTGGGVQSQDYWNESENYTISSANIYWPRVGVPLNKLSHTVALYQGVKSRIPGSDWVKALKDNNVGKRYAVYMVQDGQKIDYDAFKAYNETVVPISITPPTATETRNGMADLARKWLLSQLPNQEVFSRIRIAKRVLITTDAQWNSISTAIAQHLNDAGVSQ